MADQKEDARLALLCQSAYLLKGPCSASPAPAMLGPDWKIRGYLSAQDAIFHRAGVACDSNSVVFYGFLAESVSLPGNFVACLRGTIDMIEWGENGEFLLEKHVDSGRVETGFYDIYRTLTYTDAHLTGPAAPGIGAVVGAGTVTVVGHSLGAALATYLTLDLAKTPGMRVRGRFFASPHPGDGEFSQHFDSNVADYMAYLYELDVVPRIPFGFGYEHVKKVRWMTPKTSQARVSFDIGCHHYLSSYIAMMDFSLNPAASLLAPSSSACIKGPTVI